MANYDVLISYLIEDQNDSVHSFVKKCMEEKGYYDAFLVIDPIETQKVVYLPHTTLWKPNTVNTTASIRETLIKEKLQRFLI